MSISNADPIEPRSAPDAIANIIRGMIHRGELSPGDRLPPEREFAEQLGVGRLTLRSALAVLQHDGYLVSKRGAKGGTFVTELERPYQQWLERMRADAGELEDILDFRVAIERHAAMLAAERHDPEDLRAMEGALQRLDTESLQKFRMADASFHAAIGKAARSPRLIDAIQAIRGELFVRADTLNFPLDPAVEQAKHRAIYEAVRERQADAAARAVQEHLEETRRELQAILGLKG